MVVDSTASDRSTPISAAALTEPLKSRQPFLYPIKEELPVGQNLRRGLVGLGPRCSAVAALSL